MMKLRRFYVRKFRSVDDSGWIDTDTITTLVGINEAGKSNLLLALWKLNPARDGEINLLTDIPRGLYSSLRDNPDKPDFIEAEFGLDSDQIVKVSELTGYPAEDISIVNVKCNYNGYRSVHFPNARDALHISSDEVRKILDKARIELDGLDEQGKGEKGVKNSADNAFQGAVESIEADSIDSKQLDQINSLLGTVSSSLKTSQIAPLIRRTVKNIEVLKQRINRPHPNDSQNAKGYILEELPSFVYYSSYGNLDSEIYLPHVIENLKRSDLVGRIAAQTRTLRVLFNFVSLDPKEILDKGREPAGQLNQHGKIIQKPTQDEIDKAREDKRERDVLLHSASTRLTKEFRKWWQQGNYVFDLAADGNHFRIWVSDEERPAKIELENRSTGLQWFLSFFLVFLVESEEAHKGAIVLLDEAGLSLHALAQKDLVKFFEDLSKTNQLIHTTHSPFLVNIDHIDRVKVVYVDNNGYTVASSDLRAGERSPQQSKSIYAVHAALGLTVSEAILQGCHPVIVEGTSDQYYLSAIKNHLINQGHLTPKREIVFPPSGGVKGVTSVAAILASKDEELPFVLLDSDKNGRDFKKKLFSGQYKGSEKRVVEVNDVLDLKNAEIEDLIPFDLLRPAITRLFRDIESEFFEDIYDSENTIVLQIEDFADRHNVVLEIGWKVELSRQVKARLLQGKANVDEDRLEMWQSLFSKIYP